MVGGIYCPYHRQKAEEDLQRMIEERSQRMSDPEFQAKLQAARAAKRKEDALD